MAAAIKRVKGRPVCTTAIDARGTAHIRNPTVKGEAVCGRRLEQAGKRNGKNCGGCAEGAAEANAILRKYLA